MPTNQVIVYGLVAVCVVALLAFRVRRMMRATPFNPYLAWALPALFLVLSGLALYAAKPTGGEWAWVIPTFAVGAGLGYLRGRSIQMAVEPATGRLMAQGSAMAMLFIVVLIGARSGLSYLLRMEASAIALRPMMANVLPTVLGAGLFVARGIEMGLRGHGLLEAARTAPPAALADAP